MATLYIDYDNGNDNYGGTSFALKASGTDGRISGSTFSSVTASFPNDGSLIDQYLSIFNGTIYAVYRISAWVSSTSLTIVALSGGTALADQTINRQYYIGGRWKTITSGATAVRTLASDTIRVMGHPTYLMTTTSTWTGTRLQNSVNISSSTNATPIEITTSSAHGLATGDTVIITGHTTNTNANGTWEITYVSSTKFTLDTSTGNGVGGASGSVRPRTNTVVRLNSAVTQNIASFGNTGSGRTAWTQSSNVTASLNTSDSKEGDCSDSIAVGAAFTTGLAAYKSFSTLDLSGYQQLSFWIKQTAGTVGASNAISLKLCSDTAGATAVNTFDIENLVVTNRWVPITINLGTNLGNSIQSIGFYVNTDNGAQTFLLSNIIACKATTDGDALNLCSLIGTDYIAKTMWCPIQSINGTRILLDGSQNTTPWATSNNATSRGYNGSTQSNVYAGRIETVKTAMASTQTTTVQEIQENGGDWDTNITYEFGYDRTDMSTRSDNYMTIFDGRNGLGYGLLLNTKYWLTFSNLGLVRYDQGLRLVTAQWHTFNYLQCIGCTTYNISLTTGSAVSSFNDLYCCFGAIGLFSTFGCSGHTFNNAYFNNNMNQGWSVDTMNSLNITNFSVDNHGGQGLYFNGCANCVFTSGTINNNSEGLRFLWAIDDITMRYCSTSGNIGNSFFGFGGELNLYNSTMYEAAEAANYNYGNSRINSQNHDNTPNNHYIFTDLGSIRATTSVRHTDSGVAWALAPTSTSRRINYPLDLKIATVAVSANSLVTVKAWMRRTNTELTMRLRVRGGQIAGVSNDVTSYMSAAADTWEQVSLTFTPTEDGVIDVYAEAYGGTTRTGYVDDITITQA